MPVKHVRAKKAGTISAMKGASSARLSPYIRGIVYGMRLAGATLEDIHKVVRKPDGSKSPSKAFSHAFGFASNTEV